MLAMGGLVLRAAAGDFSITPPYAAPLDGLPAVATSNMLASAPMSVVSVATVLPQRLMVLSGQMGLEGFPHLTDLDPGAELNFSFFNLLKKSSVSDTELRSWLQTYKDFQDRETALANARRLSQ